MQAFPLDPGEAATPGENFLRLNVAVRLLLRQQVEQADLLLALTGRVVQLEQDRK